MKQISLLKKMIKSTNVNTEGNKAGISIKKTEAY